MVFSDGFVASCVSRSGKIARLSLLTGQTGVFSWLLVELSGSLDWRTRRLFSSLVGFRSSENRNFGTLSDFEL